MEEIFKMAKETFDFSGWATRNDIKCSDGRTIRKDAFKHCDGQTVPLVWNHNHTDADNVLGKALLENRKEGVYAYCSFNGTENGKNAKELVKHGDIVSLSIYANQLKQNGGDVIHGAIKEVSLVLAGENPGAKIENVMAHGELDEESATIWNGVTEFNYDVDVDVDSISHADAPKAEAEKEKSPEEGKEETIADVYNTLTEKQKLVVNALIGAALEEKAENDDQEEDEKMKHNAFEQTNEIETNVLSLSDLVDVIADAKKFGSLKDAYIAKCNEKEVDLQHSINNLDVLFPEVKAINNTPVTINDDTNWVAKVMGGVHHTPFSRVKMMAFDITGEEARARGYIKGNKKEEEVIAALRRETSPQTVYKLQKLDRDDIVDVTDFDVVAYIKNEMRGKLDEEIARAVLIGDG